jgi:hypothetical protein
MILKTNLRCANPCRSSWMGGRGMSAIFTGEFYFCRVMRTNMYTCSSFCGNLGSQFRRL